MTTASIVVSLLDEILQKGYGFGNGVSAFIGTKVCEGILLSMLSPSSFKVEDDLNEYQGSIVNLFHSLITKPNKILQIQHAFFRENAPNLSSLILTLLAFFVIIYYKNFSTEITVTHKKSREHKAPYPFKLFYTSYMPVLLHIAIVYNVYFFSVVLHKSFKGTFLAGIFGKWSDPVQGLTSPVGGLAYYVTPPSSAISFFYDPIHMIFYCAVVIAAYNYFAKMWVNISGQNARDTCKFLRDKDLTIQGFRDEVVVERFRDKINEATTTGGVVMGALCIFADWLGAISHGTGILLAVNIVFEYFEKV